MENKIFLLRFIKFQKLIILYTIITITKYILIISVIIHVEIVTTMLPMVNAIHASKVLM